MNQPSKPGKRIISKGEYVANTGKKAALSSYGAAVILTGIVSAGMIFAFLCLVGGGTGGPSVGADRCLFVLGVGILSVAPLALFYYGGKAVKDAIEMDAGVPLTRANTADLPAAESLVRASEIPAQEQAAILLRAATQGQTTPPEELVRASIGPLD
jgi:hypothetical protein